jgi:lipopolysaccharide biosynthesis glycosyltransferase
MYDKAVVVINTNLVMSNDSRISIMEAATRWDAVYLEVKKSDAQFAHHALKLKVFELCDFDNICVLDSDTIVREDAPDIFAQAPEEEFVAVRNRQRHYPMSYWQPNIDIAQQQIEYLIELHELEDKNIDVDVMARNFFNSGVFVVNRQHHALTLAYAFHLFCRGLQWWDQIPLNLAVQILHGGYRDIGSMWNWQFPQHLDQMTTYIYHFAGDPARYDKLEGNVNWRVE